MKKRNVLILEDDVVIYQHLTEVLQKMGFIHIFTATNQKEALDLAENYRFDIMLSTVKIDDGYDGVDTVKVLQKLYDLAVIFICTHSDVDIISKIVEVDFIGYLIKPFREDELQTLVSLAIIKSKAKELYTFLKTVGEYRFDVEKSVLYKAKEHIKLSKKEQSFFLLYFLNLDIVIPYSVVDENVWPNENVKENTRRTFLYRIKKRFPDLPFEIVKNVGIIAN